jgi:hypothetical protein
MDKLLFWLGIGAAQKRAGSKEVKPSRHPVTSFVVGTLLALLIAAGVSFCWSVNDEAYAAASLRLLKLKETEVDMQGAEADEPEMSFRRGYQQGAIELFYAIERFLDPATREVVRPWIEKDVYIWW